MWKMKKKNNDVESLSAVEAGCPDVFSMICESIKVEGIEAAAGVPKFHIVAYTGGSMYIPAMPAPVVVDLAGMILPDTIAVLSDHDPTSPIGHGTPIVADNQLLVDGIVSVAENPKAIEFAAASKRGFPWQASIGASIIKVVKISEGKTFEANGREHTAEKGGMFLVTESKLKEVSVLSLGADDETSAAIAAADKLVAAIAAAKVQEKDAMYKPKTKATDVVDIKTDIGFVSAELKAAADKIKADEVAAQKAAEKAEVDEIRATAITDERKRLAGIEAACKGFDGAEAVGELRAKAIKGEISTDALQAGILDIVRTARPKAPAIGGKVKTDDQKMLLAAGCQAGGVGEAEIIKLCGEPAIEAADGVRGMGIQEFFARAAMIEGVELPSYRNDALGFLKAAFSTMTLPGILGAVANKTLLEGYLYVEDTWRQICAIASVKNFQLHTRYRMTGDFIFQAVGKDGELQHATVDQQTYTQQIDTKGAIFSLTRQAIIDDNLGTFLAIPRMLGVGAGEAISLAVWTLLLSNPGSFFAGGNNNYSTGSGTALDIDSLTAAELLFLDQTKPNGRPVGIAPSRLLVPNALKVTAQQLMSSLKLTEGGGSSASKVPTDNPHAGKFDVITSSYLGNSSISGYSVKAWYLFADPNRLAAIEVAFLNGVDRPTVEKADADFNTLGVQFRGFLDFGVKEQDHRGAVKMRGEA